MIHKKGQRLFSNYFIDKIDRIRKELDESDLSPKNDTCVTKKTTHETILKSFSPACEEEVNKILKFTKQDLFT